MRKMLQKHVKNTNNTIVTGSKGQTWTTFGLSMLVSVMGEATTRWKQIKTEWNEEKKNEQNARHI